MKVSLSALGKFHTFDLARELHKRGLLLDIATTYPKFKLKNENIPLEMVRTFPYLYAPHAYLQGRKIVGPKFSKFIGYYNQITFAKFVASNPCESDIYMGLSGSSLEAGIKAKNRGSSYICDRGSAHIAVQDEILRTEHQILGLPYAGIDSRIIDREEQEYEHADVITVPSTFARDSFTAKGIPVTKLAQVPYGVDLSRFRPEGRPDPGAFNVLFVGRVTVQKGIHYLLEAFQKFDHPNKKLTVVGPFDPSIIKFFSSQGLIDPRVSFVGQVPQSHLVSMFSTSDVMVLPSLQEGLAMVMAQALACGCPVIASENTGAKDLFTNGREGYIVPIRDSEAILDRLNLISNNPPLAQEMRLLARERVSVIGGWSTYADGIVKIMQSL